MTVQLLLLSKDIVHFHYYLSIKAIMHLGIERLIENK
jgi:hypothetical protein